MASSPRPPVSQTAPSVETQRDGDLHAWMVQYGPALRRYFLRRTAGAEADDLVQEVFVKLQARGETSAIDNVERYLFRTAASVLADRHRRPGWQWGAQEHIDGADMLVDEVSPERIVIGREAIGAIVSALEELPPRSAQAFFLIRFEQLTQEEAARRMGVSVKAVEELMRRAFRLLRAKVGASL
ncbi:MAG: RNA polymerase sigma factor [Ignavibacteriales bacterium]